MNSLEYYWEPFPISKFKWEVTIEGYKIQGEARTIRELHKRAKKAIKRHRKMKKVLDG